MRSSLARDLLFDLDRVPRRASMVIRRIAGPVIAGALLAWLVAFQAARLATTPLAYDDAYLAAAAKSLAFGHGYATHYPEAQPRLGGGLALQLPASALVALLGNRYWTPGLATVLAIDLLLVATFVHLRRRLEREALYPLAITGLLAIAVLTADEQWILSHWFALLGDLPASMAIVLGMLLLARDLENRGGPGIAAGLMLGLAAEIKLVSLLGIAPAVLIALAGHHRFGEPGAIRRSLRFVGAILLPTAAVHLAQFVALGPAGYGRRLVAWVPFVVSEGGSGLAGAPPVAARLISNARSAREYFEGTGAATGVLLVAALVVASLALARPCGRSGSGEVRRAGMLLWVAAVVHASWWLLLSPTGYINHLLPGLVYLAGAFAAAVTVTTRPRLVAALLLAAGMVLIPRVPFLMGYLPRLTAEPGVASALTMRDVLVSQKAAGRIHLGCGWWVPRDLEYLLPEVGNFDDCRRVEPSRFAAERPVLVRRVAFWNWERDPRLDRFAAACERNTIFRNADYVVSECTAPP